MDKKIEFKSENNRKYLLSKANSIIYRPSSKKQTEVQKQKEIFFENNEIINDFIPNLTAVYNPSDLQANLANLRMLIIEVTDGCNLACKYCGYGELYNNYDARKGKKQNYEDIKAIIDYLYTLWKSPLNTSFNTNIVIGFYGGEPLLAFDIIEKTISYIEALNVKEITFSYDMTTNAFLLDKYMDYLVDKKFKLLLSLDGDEACNSYRLTKDNKSSFQKIHNNILLLKEKYPNYFEENVRFNSVLHNLNSVSDIYTFIKDNYGKIPTISELNSNGIADDKKEKFYTMFKNKTQSIKEADACTGLIDDILNIDNDIESLSHFIDAFTSNTFQSYTDLFINESTQKFIPTGTCKPFKRKLFLTVNGKLLPCERVGQKYPLGFVENGIIKIDYQRISDFYAEMYKEIIPFCNNCVLWKNCTLCIYYMPMESGKKKCNRFMPKNKASNYFSYYMSYVEKHPKYYMRLIREMDNY